jgi:hypothetical protein
MPLAPQTQSPDRASSTSEGTRRDRTSRPATPASALSLHPGSSAERCRLPSRSLRGRGQGIRPKGARGKEPHALPDLRSYGRYCAGCIICGARIRRSDGEHRTRLTLANRRHWPPDAMPRGAVNLWTVGCADPRLTAQARSPMDKPEKTQWVSPACPQVGGCPQASQHRATRRDEFDFGEW